MGLMLLTLAVLFVYQTAGHGTLTKPLTRNRGPLDQKGPADYQSGNGGGKGFNSGYRNGAGSSACGDGIWGFSNNQGGGGIGWHYRGGDAKGAALHKSWKVLLQEYNPDLHQDVRQEYIQGQKVKVQAQITAYHGGHMTFHLCPVAEGEIDFDVEECGILAPAGSPEHKKNLLNNLTSTTLPPPSQFCSNCGVDSTSSGPCGFNPGCWGNGPDGFAVLDITLEPPQVPMDHGVLVWHWFTDNNGQGYVGGEEFMNCADVRVLPAFGSAPTTTNVHSTTTLPTSTVAPTPVPTSHTVETSTDAPTHTEALTPAPTDMVDPAQPTVACAAALNGPCDGCLAKNNVCYAQGKSWCDAFSYTWCGTLAFVHSGKAQNVRKHQQHFLGNALIQSSAPLKRVERADEL